MADHPATGVTWTEAQSFCSAMGKALPTEAQWEYAASPDPAAETQAPYPWGDAPPTCGKANFMDCHLLATVPLGSTTGATALGIRDMAGNAREWVHDAYGPYRASWQVDPRGTGNGDLRVLRGGSFGGAAEDIRVSDRDVGDPAQRSVYNGFRCAVPVVGVVDDASTDRGSTEEP
jgi:iron(II)-dependent oxidoreductase